MREYNLQPHQGPCEYRGLIDLLQRALHAAQNGQYRKAMKALTSEGTAPADEMVLKDMLSKHPQVPSPGIPPGPTPPINCLSQLSRKE